ncbi:hypothetical protein GH714_012551 [Hevea brasiliensis]|uniref:Reverse transcriptase Ty1/copia-type domain-containing protein n=1 Tax=Hevea brasiliensis TaxID=3981 RepID=A0A6A6MIT6_HEVBR|nr:hypothetical protein GH714_012551 [Hevea brasiliensis]
MSEEFNALLKNGTWVLVPHESHQNLVGCKWIFRIKRHADGSIQRHKARLVAKGYNQRPGIDFGDTFNPVVKPVTIRVVLTLAVTNSRPLLQLDINNAFLHDSLQEDVYTKNFLSQHHYVRKLLQLAHMDGAKEVTTPMATASHLVKSSNNAQAIDPTEYHQLVGGLQYLNLTKPDVAFSVNKLSQFMHCPSNSHWQARKRLLRYLKSTINFVLHSKMKHLEIDVHFVRDLVQREDLRVSHISSKDQLADLLTKPLSKQQFILNRSKIGIQDGSSILWGSVKAIATPSLKSDMIKDNNSNVI